VAGTTSTGSSATLGGRLRQIYLGPADDSQARELRDRLAAYKGRRRSIVDNLERLTAAYIASGGPRHLGQHFRIVDALARAGLFRTGVLLVGSHAFVSIGAALGVSWSAEDAATADIDLCRDQFVTIARDEETSLDVPGVLQSLDPSFFLGPELDLKRPSTSLTSRKSGIKLDLLTTARTPRDERSRVVAPLGLAAQPLRYMDYFVCDDVRRGLFLGPHAIPVNVPTLGAAHFTNLLSPSAAATARPRSRRKRTGARQPRCSRFSPRSSPTHSPPPPGPRSVTAIVASSRTSSAPSHSFQISYVGQPKPRLEVAFHKRRPRPRCPRPGRGRAAERRSQTPDEVFFGTAPNISAVSDAGRAKARQATPGRESLRLLRSLPNGARAHRRAGDSSMIKAVLQLRTLVRNVIVAARARRRRLIGRMSEFASAPELAEHRGR